MKVVTLTFLIILSISINTAKEEFEVEKGVIKLTDDNFNNALKKYDYLVVMFYAPWCGQTKKFKDKYISAAEKLKKDGIYLAKVNGVKEKGLIKQFDIKRYPQIKIFIKGLPISYKDSRTEEKLMEWALKKKNNSPVKEYNSEQEIKKKIENNDIFVMYFGDKEKEFEEYKKVGYQYDEEYEFGTCKSSDIAKKFNTKLGTVVLFKNFDERRNELTTLNQKDIDEFIKKYSIPKVTPINEKNLRKIMEQKRTLMILYTEKKDEKKDKENEKMLYKVSEQLKGELVVGMTNIDEGEGKRLSEHNSITKEMLPLLRITDLSSEPNLNYDLKETINEKNILEFVNKWKKKQIAPTLKTEPIPKENNGDVFVVVGASYKKEVINNKKDVMLLFYAPWCGHCKKFHPVYEDMARRLKENNPNLLFAKIDATQNEVEGVSISGYPTIKFYPGNKKDREPLEYNGEREFNPIFDFIKNNAYNKVVEENKTEDKTEDKKDKKEEDL